MNFCVGPTQAQGGWIVSISSHYRKDLVGWAIFGSSLRYHIIHRYSISDFLGKPLALRVIQVSSFHRSMVIEMLILTD